ncbi:high mobility group B protein 13 [Corylus avellana]|uniref:high mobility group B protein 13 n=1 Tax=Corylus avellana TaxID=13451 RepID=UPI001E1FB82E|nr:high mobility group B protein 13 [Corylus avellana]
MQTARSSLAGDQNLRLKSGRRPLQPKNCPANPVPHSTPITKPKQEPIEISVAVDDRNKENRSIYSTPPAKIDSLDASLAEELSAIRKKLDRLRSDRERTEKMLRERDMVLELNMKELEERGEIQKKLEIEVDRLYRLNELKSHSMRVSPIRSLREKEQVKKINEGQSPELKFVGESVTQSPGSASSGIVVEK